MPFRLGQCDNEVDLQTVSFHAITTFLNNLCVTSRYDEAVTGRRDGTQTWFQRTYAASVEVGSKEPCHWRFTPVPENPKRLSTDCRFYIRYTYHGIEL